MRSQKIEIRLLQEKDIPLAMKLKNQAGWNQIERDWKRFLSLEPEGCFLALLNGQPAGTTVAVRYGKEVAWIGMVLVEARLRGRGIGRKLLEHALAWLREAGVRTVKLDATPAGRPLYEKLGFVEECTIFRWSGSGRRSTAFSLPAVNRADLAEVVTFDTFYFGTCRERVLYALMRDYPGSGFVSRGPDGTINGYGLARKGEKAMHLGPVVASSVAVAEKILDNLLCLAAGSFVFIDVIERNGAATSLVARRAFTRQRGLTRMYLGENSHPGEISGIYAISGGEKG